MMAWKPEPNVIDIRSILIFRILLGCYLCYDILSRLSPFPYSIGWYSNNEEIKKNSFGFLSDSDSPHGNIIHQYLFARTSDFSQYCLFGVTFLLSLGFCLGKLKSIQSHLVLWILVVSMQHRCMHVHDGSDNYTRQLLLWYALLPSDEVHERLYNIINPLDNRKLLLASPQIKSLGCLGLTLQITCMYMGTIAKRTIDYNYGSSTMEWLPPSSSAVHYIIRDSFAIRDSFFNKWIRRQPLWVTQMMTTHAMIAESSALLWFLSPFTSSNLRWFGFLLTFSLHLGLLIVTRLPNWQFIGMAASFLWIPSCAYEYYGWNNNKDCNEKKHPKKIDAYTRDDSTFNNNNNNDDGIVTQKKKTKKEKKPLVLLRIFLLFYMIYNFCGERGWLQKIDGGDIGEFLRTSQFWVMYSTPPKTAYDNYILGHTRRTIIDNDNIISSKKDGEPKQVEKEKGKQEEQWIDVMQAIRENSWVDFHQTTRNYDDNDNDSNTIILPLHYDNLQKVVSPRWERALDQWSRQRDRKRIKTFLKGLCRRIPESARIESLEFVSISHQIASPPKVVDHTRNSIVGRYSGKPRHESVKMSCI